MGALGRQAICLLYVLSLEKTLNVLRISLGKAQEQKSCDGPGQLTTALSPGIHILRNRCSDVENIHSGNRDRNTGTQTMKTATEERGGRVLVVCRVAAMAGYVHINKKKLSNLDYFLIDKKFGKICPFQVLYSC